MTKYLAIAFLITGFLVGDAYGDDLIADVHFDDGSVLHNAKLKKSYKIRVKYENEIFILNFEDLKTLELLKVERGKVIQHYKGRFVNDFESIGEEAIVTLKIKTKTGIVINDRFSTVNREGTNIPCRGGYAFSFTNKLTGKEITKTYPMQAIAFLKLEQSPQLIEERSSYCLFTERKTKAIKSIVFKDGNEKIEEI
jgi:hypothetical protein